jgi:hypothetical protein
MPIFQVPKKMSDTLLLSLGELLEYDFSNLLISILVTEGSDTLLTGIESHHLLPLMHGDIQDLKEVSCHARIVMSVGLLNVSVFSISS